MAFNNLSLAMQNVAIHNYIMFYKFILILIFISCAILIVSNFKPKDSKYKMVKMIRGVYYVMSWIVISTIPLHFIYLSPNISLDVFIRVLFWAYGLNFIVLGLIISLNVIMYGKDFMTELLFDKKNKNPLLRDIGKYFISKTDVEL